MTTGFDHGRTLAERFRNHAGDSTTLYGYAMRGMADDWEAGGVVRAICQGWEDAAPGSVIQLRLLAGVHRLVLRREAPALAPYYASVGGEAAPDGAWPVMRAVMAAHLAELQEALTVAPQTNEVGRSAALLVGIFEAVRRSGISRLRLLEPGASAGLNLLVDRFRFETTGWSYGPHGSPLVLPDAIQGSDKQGSDKQGSDKQACGTHGYDAPVAFSVVSRRGCDLAPVDIATPEGRVRLTSFVWPFQVERHERLRAALEIARQTPVTVDRAGAGEWLERQLARPPDPAQGGGVLTVVWHSVTRLYWPQQESGRVAAAIDDARSRMPLAHVAMEYPVATGADQADLTLDGEVLARVAHHGSRVELI